MPAEPPTGAPAPASLPLEDYALLGDCETAALVSRGGSIDWLCVPRFDSPAWFAALLGSPEHGRWLLTVDGEVRACRRRYQGDTLVLETEYETPSGRALVIDFMAQRDGSTDVVRIVVGVAGQVSMRTDLSLRFDYGSVIPWVRKADSTVFAIAGPEAARLRTPVPLRGAEFHTVGRFTVSAGQRLPFVLTFFPSHEKAPPDLDPEVALREAITWWSAWSARCSHQGPWRDAVVRSLLTLKALTYRPTGGIVAAPTTSLPEAPGGTRNWDYRYCWIRDATFTLDVLVDSGYLDEARAFREWLLRAVAGKPSQMHLMYGVAGERRLPELELGWLPGYEASRPVRIGNAAHVQTQIDVYGELMDAMHTCWEAGLEPGENAWRVERAAMQFLEHAWREPDNGIWEVRGPMRHFTHSKVMAWVAFDRAVKAIERFGMDGPIERWRALRDEIHREVCARGFDASRGCFVQHYGASETDASLLMMPLVGFLPASDPRIVGTVATIERDLMVDGFVHRYRTRPEIDGLPPGEAAFLLCSFWMADVLALSGRRAEGEAMFQRLLAIRNDVGLLSEAYDPRGRRQLGNYPQAFSHVGLINTALNLSRAAGAPTPRARVAPRRT